MRPFIAPVFFAMNGSGTESARDQSLAFALRPDTMNL